eukprot:TRINITY_DN12640_c0_g1_i1.p1 TRINITY_DN12640_c0_g1~~TRINITY_DN12640_c0_g1_i1.p1  ORF type:complete len:285 (+),score=16.08 TRINITY_DN12640_c0_g1_i1:38-892(+)
MHCLARFSQRNVGPRANSSHTRSPVTLNRSPSITTSPSRSAHALVGLPYDHSLGIAPFLSSKAFNQHYFVRTNDHIKKANQLSFGTKYDLEDLERSVVRTTLDSRHAGLAHHLGAAWNHQFFFSRMLPKRQVQRVPPFITSLVQQTFGGWEQCRGEFMKHARAQIGSGWIWLLCPRDGKLVIQSTPNEFCPLLLGVDIQILAGLDMWEHSYYPDYGTDYMEYIKRWFDRMNWEMVDQGLEEAPQTLMLRDTETGEIRGFYPEHQSRSTSPIEGEEPKTKAYRRP